MKLFGGKLSVITIPELFAYAARTQGLIRLELCHCKELKKLVVRVAGCPEKFGKEQLLGVLVDARTEEYFVAAHSINSIRSKLARLLLPIWNRFVVVPLEQGMLLLFQGGEITEAEGIEYS